MFQGRYIFLLLLLAPSITTTLTIPVNIHRFGAQDLKCAIQSGIFNANKMPVFGGHRVPCPYFLDRLPGGAPSNQHLLPDFFHFPSPEEHQGPFGDSAHINNSLSFPALCFHLFMFSVQITFLRENTVSLTEQLYICLLKGSLIMKNPILKPTSWLSEAHSEFYQLFSSSPLGPSCERLQSIKHFSVGYGAGTLPTGAQRLLCYLENGICHMCLHHLVFHNLPEWSG